MKIGRYCALLLLVSSLGQAAFAGDTADPLAPQEAQHAMQQPPVAAPQAETGSGAGAPPVAAVAGVPAAAALPATEASPAASSAARSVSVAAGTSSDIKPTDAVLVLFAGLLVLLGWMQARRLRDVLAVAKDSASIAERSARVAEEALIAGQRAFLFIRDIKTYLRQDAETGAFEWTLHPIWANSGNTPTRGLELRTSYRLLDAPLPADYVFPEPAEPPVSSIAGPRSMVEAAQGTIGSDDLASVQRGEKFFYIWGTAEYHDIFEGSRKRTTRFCNQLVQVDGDPAAPAGEHNPVQMVFGFHAGHNSAD